MKVALFIILGKLFSTLSLQFTTQSAVHYPNGTDVNQVQNVTVNQAVQILENANGTHPEESKQLLKRLKWLINTFNITKLVLDRGPFNVTHTNVSNIHTGRSGGSTLEENSEDGFLHVKYAILKFSRFTSSTVSPQPVEEKQLSEALIRSEKIAQIMVTESFDSDR
ncbi:unnamed protein product [Spodoptera littoralis]|uniref:Uncharacterized protein n=1 Tax=Spodoptera littoralis TaxID=7109 RepID=A0A9P0IMV0_SPOLI|nr:unnamed protein product [Spodoptera littoralis]CAH1647888.1 unnamed protein product [Spodoptera littoralis]